MSRPIKDTVDYFFHDVKHGKTLRILQGKYGNDGYAVWFKTLELLGSSNGHYYDFSQPLDKEDMVVYMGVEEGLCMQIFGTLAHLNKLDKELLERKVLWGPTFIERLNPLYTRRKQDAPVKPHTKTELMPTETHRVEESRGEKSREEERKKYINPLLGEHGNVKITESELASLKEYVGSESVASDLIERLSLYLASSGKKYASHYATMQTWFRKDKEKQSESSGPVVRETFDLEPK